MPQISQRQVYNGAEERITRLGLDPLWEELQKIVTDFELLVKEERNANGGGAVRELLDQRFNSSGGWKKSQTGRADWEKCVKMPRAQVCLAVEIQFSGRSDLLIVDVDHLREAIVDGRVDVGVIVVPSDRLAVFLTDRVARFRDAVQSVTRARAEDLPLVLLGLDHDGAGPPLAKQRTRQGKKP